jgi:glutathione synthase/RimK-type ligase-like ATP-grasp enzyme
MARLAILTPDPEESNYGEIWPPFFERLAAPLRAEGLTVEAAPWTRPLVDADAYCALMTWGYHHRWDEWLAFLKGAGERRLINPAVTLRWNGDKAYLAELAALGVATPPTVSVDHAGEQAVALAFEGFGCDELVVKPRVSGGAFQTVRLRRGQSLVGGPTGPALIQPYLPAVSTEGEWSLLYFGGELSHALTKVAAPGDFRVQPQFGGAVTAGTPPAAAVSAAERVLAACPHPLVYARVDLLADGEGGYLLMELEAIEPHLFLDQSADGGAGFARAMKAAVAG